MSGTAKKALLIIAGLLVCALTYFFVFQPNLDETNALEAETGRLQGEVNRLTALQAQIAELKPKAEMHQTEMDMYFAEYPSKMTQQKALYNIYRMMVDTGMRVTAISPGEDLTFMQAGAIAGSDAAVMSSNTDEAPGAGSTAEEAPETKVPITDIVGKYATYQMSVTGKKSEIYAALDWMSENMEHMSIGNVALAFDPGTGGLVGTIDVNFYSMNGNGIAYVEPDISEIVIGSKDVFGTGEKPGGKRTYQEPGQIITINDNGDSDADENAESEDNAN